MMIQIMVDGNKIKVKETVKGKSLLLASEQGFENRTDTFKCCLLQGAKRLGDRQSDRELGKKEKGENIFMSARSPKQRCLL